MLDGPGAGDDNSRNSGTGEFATDRFRPPRGRCRQDPAGPGLYQRSAHQEAIAMREAPGERVVLLGGGMAGLLVARVLSEFFKEVLIVDRDELNGVAGYRRGVPHGRHAHGLVARGHEILEQQFPGLTEDMAEAGVEPGDFN